MNVSLWMCGWIKSYLPWWGRLSGVKIQIEVLHLFVSFWLHHRATPTIRSHGCTKLHVLHKSVKDAFIDGRGTLRQFHSETKLIFLYNVALSQYLNVLKACFASKSCFPQQFQKVHKKRNLQWTISSKLIKSTN